MKQTVATSKAIAKDVPDRSERGDLAKYNTGNRN
jgi:hypothetical protein